MKTLKVLSALLSYPTAELQAAAEEMKAVLEDEGLIGRRQRAAVNRLIDDLAGSDLMDAQARYVLLFDRSRSTSLHLFEHVHGESRDRGQAMVDLLEMYRAAGLEIEARELPDYLPLFLEFLSTRSQADACETLGQPLHIIAALGQRLRKRGSPYAAAFDALQAIAAGKADAEEVEALLQEEEDDPNDGEALDRVWREDPVTFGPGPQAPGQGDCPKVSEMLERMGRLDPAEIGRRGQKGA